MKKNSAHVVGTLRRVFLGLVLLVGPIDGVMTAQAENGRDFAGFFSVTEVVEGTEEVSLSVSLEIFNYSGLDVTNASLRIEHGFPEKTLYEFPTPIDIAYRSRAILTAPILVIPRQQFDQWAQGRLPSLRLIYTHGGDLPRSSNVELVPMVMERNGHP